jgi:tRNA(fMet)-specific endonuclease VapC
MLDTDISSYIIRDRPESVRRRFQQLDYQQLCISVVTEAELRYGVRRARRAPGIDLDVEDFLRRLAILSWDSAAAAHYAEIRARLEATGTPIGNMDLMIAAHARSLGATVVTNNERHFEKVPRLPVENWA